MTTHALAHALAARARGELDEAAAAAAEALLAAPDDPRVHLLHGSLAHLRGDLPAAITAYRHALARAPDDADAHTALAVALMQSDQPHAAHEHFAAACRNPTGLWSGLRTLRLAREAHTTPHQPWTACATPLFEAEPRAPGLLSHAQRLAPGRESWTLADLRRALADHPRVVALTGAGISAASGLQTRKQLWRQFSRDDAVSVVRFHHDPRTLWTVIHDFWGERCPAPNPAHAALARLPGLLGIITQNVDELHQAAAAAAGTDTPILELHGSLLRTRCTTCARLGPPAPGLPRDADGLPPPCPCGGRLRPDVVLFGERVPSRTLAAAAALVTRADILILVGCAMDVSPASELPLLAALAGARIVEIKRQPSHLSTVVHVHHVAGAAEHLLPAL